jgi:hypothetical protein
MAQSGKVGRTATLPMSLLAGWLQKRGERPDLLPDA